jgi:hypothetical protein
VSNVVAVSAVLLSLLTASAPEKLASPHALPEQL